MKRKGLKYGVLLVFLLILLSGCQPDPSRNPSPQTSPDASSQAVPLITPEEAKSKADQQEGVFVDVRTKEEYMEKHIPGALLVPNETIGAEKPAVLPEGDVLLMVYCRTGVRSRQAAEKLRAMGYTHVLDLGGIQSWPYDTVSGEAP